MIGSCFFRLHYTTISLPGQSFFVEIILGMLYNIYVYLSVNETMGLTGDVSREKKEVTHPCEGADPFASAVVA